MIRIRILLLTTHQRKRKDGTYPVVLQVVEPNNTRTPFVLKGFNCLTHQFDNELGRFNKDFPKYKVFNRILQEKENLANDVIGNFIKKEENFDIERFKLDYFSIKANLTVEEAFDFFINKMIEAGEIGNATVFKTCRNKVKAFDPSVKLSHITIQWLSAWEHFIKTKSDKEVIKDTSVSNYMRTLRSMLNKAIEQGFLDKEDYPFGHKYSITHLNLKTRPRALSKEWIREIEAVELAEDKPIAQSRNNLLFARDIFLFSYYTFGMNFSDISHLKTTDVKMGRIEYTRKKTHDPHSIGLHPKAKEILQKYSTAAYQDYAFPILNDVTHVSGIQKKHRVQTVLKDVNSSLKQITEKLGIDNLNMSSYVSRHSFANIVRKNGATLEEISELLQHKDINTTRIYLESLTDEQKDKWLDVL